MEPKNTKTTHNRIYDSALNLLHKPDLLISPKNNSKTLRSSSTKLQKNLNSITQNKIIASQSEELEKLNKQRLYLKKCVLDLETRLQKLKNLPLVIKQKEKKIEKLKTKLKKANLDINPLKTLEKPFFSHRNTPKSSNPYIKYNNGSVTHKNHQSTTPSSRNISKRNSQSSIYLGTLTEIYTCTQSILNRWKKAVYNI
jgi:hypothetical protein